MAGKIFIGQTALKFDLDSGIDLSAGVQSTIIKYKKPSGATGTWTGSVEDTTHVVYVVVDANDIDETGQWVFWIYVTFSNGTTAAGEAAQFNVHAEGY